MNEMRWLRDHGLIASYDDYHALPLAVYEDALLLMEFDSRRAEMEAKRGYRG